VSALEVATGIFLGTIGYTQKTEAQHTLTVQAYNQQGSTLPNAQVILQTPQGTLKGTTNSSGIATFEDVQGTSTLTIAGNGIGASQSIAIDASKTFKGVIIDGTQNGEAITAQILKNTNSVDPIYVKNPMLFDITSPDPVIPVDASAFGTTDSITLMGYVAQVNALWGSAVYVPGKVEAYTDRGITLKKPAVRSIEPLSHHEKKICGIVLAF
jgi:hypothetical protein